MILTEEQMNKIRSIIYNGLLRAEENTYYGFSCMNDSLKDEVIKGVMAVVNPPQEDIEQ